MAIMRIMKMLLKTIKMIAMILTKALKSRPDWTLLRWWSKTPGLQAPIFRSLRHKKRKHKVALVHLQILQQVQEGHCCLQGRCQRAFSVCTCKLLTFLTCTWNRQKISQVPRSDAAPIPPNRLKSIFVKHPKNAGINLFSFHRTLSGRSTFHAYVPQLLSPTLKLGTWSW